MLIDVNIQVRSMGPISEMDMVNGFKYLGLYLMFLAPELLDGLLLPPVLGGSKALVLGLPGNAAREDYLVSSVKDNKTIFVSKY